jgi:hypothetical protein
LFTDNREEDIPCYDCTIRDNHSESISIAIEYESEITAVLLYFGEERLIIGETGSICVVCRERAIGICENMARIFS